jgi:hypothetical protein
LLPENAGAAPEIQPVIQIEGWNVAPETITPTVAVASAKE